MTRRRRLTPKQERFAEEFLIDFNGAAAARRAGYAKNSAHVTAAKLLTNPSIQDLIAAGRRKLTARCEISQDAVIAEFARLGFSTMKNYVRLVDGEPVVDLSDLTDDQWAAVQQIEVERNEINAEGDVVVQNVKTRFKLADKRASLVELGRHLGLFAKDNEGKLIVEDGFARAENPDSE